MKPCSPRGHGKLRKISQEMTLLYTGFDAPSTLASVVLFLLHSVYFAFKGRNQLENPALNSLIRFSCCPWAMKKDFKRSECVILQMSRNPSV